MTKNEVRSLMLDLSTAQDAVIEAERAVMEARRNAEIARASLNAAKNQIQRALDASCAAEAGTT